MQIPINCPCCGDVLINDFNRISVCKEFLEKKCVSKLDHAFRCLIETDSDKLCYVTLLISSQKNIWIYWLLADDKNYRVRIDKGKKIIGYLPYFEPDFSKYRKLINKINVYLTFS